MVWHWGLRKPVIAAMNGACAGIAVTLAAFCDLRYGAIGSKFTTAGPRLGLPSEYGLSWVLPRIVGITHAADIMLTGRIFLAEEAKEMGFLNAVYPFDEFHERVAETAQHMARQNSPAAMLTSKRQLYAELMQHDVGKSVEDSKELIGEHMRGADYSEGVDAYQEGRPPKFAGLVSGKN
jgi:enoyl-CoA hydratase/carnithine racemase